MGSLQSSAVNRTLELDRKVYVEIQRVLRASFTSGILFVYTTLRL